MKPKKLSMLLCGLVNGVLLSSCNDNNVGTSQVSNKQLQSQQNVKYDNDKVPGTWAVVNGYDGKSIYPTINMLAQNNTDAIMTFLGCENVSGTENADFGLKNFTDKPINYTKTIPSRFQEFADNYSGGYLIDSLDKQPTLQQIKFNGGDYHSDNKKQCYFAISNTDNLKPLYVKLVLDTKTIATYDATQGSNSWKSKPINDVKNLNENTKTTMHKLVDPTYGSQQLKDLKPEKIQKYINQYLETLTTAEKAELISYIKNIMTSSFTDSILFNSLLKRLDKPYYIYSKNREDILAIFKAKFVPDGKISEVGRLKISMKLFEEIKEAKTKSDYMVSYDYYTDKDGYVTYDIHPVQDRAQYTKRSFAFKNERVIELNNNLAKEYTYLASPYTEEKVKIIDNELKKYCNNIKLITKNTTENLCTPLRDALEDTSRSKVNRLSVVERQAVINSDIEMRNFTALSKLEAKITQNAVKRAGGAAAGKAAGEIGLSMFATAMGGPIGFIAEQLIFDQVLGLAMHDVSSPKDDIRVTGMQWDVVESTDAARWNDKNKDNQIAANAVKTSMINSSMANAIRVSYALEDGEVRDNQLNYTLKLDTVSTPFIRPDASSEVDPWLKDIVENVEHKGADAGSSLIKLSLSDDSDQYQNNDVDTFILKQVGLDAYVPDYLNQPQIKSTSVSSYSNTLNLNQLTSVSNHNGLSLTKIGGIEGLFISPGTVLKLGLNIPKSTKADAPSSGQRLIANYSGIGPKGEIISYGSVGSQSMFNALTESKDSIPLLFSGFDCRYPYTLGDTCNATFALSSSNQNQKSQGKLYIQDVNGEAVALPTYIGYTSVVEPHVVEGEAGTTDNGTIHIADVSGGKISKINLTMPTNLSTNVTISCTDDSLKNKLNIVTVKNYSSVSLPAKVNTKDINFRHGIAQTTGLTANTVPQCDLKFSLRKLAEGSYPITVQSIRNDGTTDIEYSKVEATAPF